MGSRFWCGRGLLQAVLCATLAAGLPFPGGAWATDDGHGGDPSGKAGRGVILYGGAFCPPHRTHIREAEAAAQAVGARLVLFIPSAPRAVQYETVRTQSDWVDLPSYRRLAMTWLATRGHPRLGVSAIELARDREGYSSSETILELARELPGPVWLLVGADVMEGIARWDCLESVLGAVDLIVTEYPPHVLAPLERYLPAGLAGRYRLVEPGLWRGPGGHTVKYCRFDTGAISSRRVREALARGEPVDRLVGPLVARYIEHFHLFQPRAAVAPHTVSSLTTEAHNAERP